MTLESYGNPRQARDQRWEIRRGSDVYVCELIIVDGLWAEARVLKNGELIDSLDLTMAGKPSPGPTNSGR
jgi:hypothetical protein